MSCRRHGVVVCAVPWARHDSSFTRSFEDQVCWLAVNSSKTAVSELMRVAWRTVGWICERVTVEATAGRDLLGGLRRIGIDEISVRKGQRYLRSSWICWVASAAGRSSSSSATWPSGSRGRSQSAAPRRRSASIRAM